MKHRPSLKDMRITRGIPEVPRFSVVPCDNGNLSYVSCWKDVNWHSPNYGRYKIYDGYNNPEVRGESNYRAAPNVINGSIDRGYGKISTINRVKLIDQVVRIFEEGLSYTHLTEIIPHDRLNPVKNDKEIDHNIEVMKEFLRDEDSEDGLITREFPLPLYKGPPTKYELERDAINVAAVIEV